MRASIERFGGFATLPFVSLVVAFVALPLIARLVSESEWAALGLGESIGAVAALVIAYGWPVVGPSRVASASDTDAYLLLSGSVSARLVAFAAVLLPGSILAIALAPIGHGWLSVAAFVSTASIGMSPSWFLIGRGRALPLALYETFPRVVATIIALVLLAAGGNALIYPLVVGGVSLGFQIAFLHREGALRELARSRHWLQAGERLRSDFVPALTMIIAGAYSAGAVAIVATAGTVAVVATFVTADRLLRASLTAIVAAANAMQGWVSDVNGLDDLRRRGFRAFLVFTLIGSLGGTALGIAGAPASELLFGENLSIDSPTAAALGAAFLAIALSTGIGRLYLVPVGALKWVLASTLLGAGCGVPTIFLATRTWGVEGAAWAFAGSEILVVAVQVLACVVVEARHRTRL